MKDFQLIFEVWTGASIMYMQIIVEGKYLPKQHDMNDRTKAVDIMQENVNQLTLKDEEGNIIPSESIQVLDLVGVFEHGEPVWHEKAS